MPACRVAGEPEQIRELQRLLGKKTLEAEILQGSARDRDGVKKTNIAVAVAAQGRFAMKAICERSASPARMSRSGWPGALSKRRGRPPLPDGELLERIKAVIADMPSYGCARVWAVLRRDGVSEDRAPVNRKRVYRVMRAHGLLLSRHAGGRRRTPT